MASSSGGHWWAPSKIFEVMDDPGFLEPGLKVHHLVVVEVLVTDGAEEDEGVPLARRLVEGKAGAGADDAGDRAGHGAGQGAAGADGAGEAGGVDPAVVDRQAAVGVGPHRPHGVDVGIRRAVAQRVVGAGDDIAVLLGAGAEPLGGELPPRPRVHHIEDRPGAAGCVAARQVEGVALIGAGGADDLLDHLAAGQGGTGSGRRGQHGERQGKNGFHGLMVHEARAPRSRQENCNAIRRCSRYPAKRSVQC